MDDDDEWTVPKKPKRRKSLFISTKNRDKTTRRMDDEDWCIPKRPKRRQSCFNSNQSRDSEEDDEPITIDKVLGFLNGDDDIIKFTTPKPDKPKAIPKDLDTDSETASLADLKPETDKLDIVEHNVDGGEKKYEMNVSVKVESGDNEFEDDEDAGTESIHIPEVPPSDDDEDLTDVFGVNKPIITSVISMRENDEVSESEDVNNLCLKEELDNETRNKERRPVNKNTFKKLYTYDHTVVTERHGELLTPVRYEPVYERKESRRQKPIVRYDDENHPVPKSYRRTKCQHCGFYFYRKDLEEHMIAVKSANNKIIDKLLQIPVVKIIDVAKDENLDPKLKARVKDLKFKMENRGLRYTLRHCVHCDKAFVTLKQFNDHIVDVIFGLEILKKDSRILDYKVKLQRI